MIPPSPTARDSPASKTQILWVFFAVWLLSTYMVALPICSPALGNRDHFSRSRQPDMQPATKVPANRALLPWLKNSSRTSAPSCVILQFGGSGLGSNFNFIIWSTGLLLQQYPDVSVYLDASTAGNACSGGLDELLTPTLPAVLHAPPGTPPPSGCETWSKERMLSYIDPFTSEQWVQWVGFDNDMAFLHQPAQLEMPLKARVRHKQIWDAMWSALCPVMHHFWKFPAKLQQHMESVKASLMDGDDSVPLVAIHTRGGDKLAADSREVPADFDYTFNKGIARVAVQLAADSARYGFTPDDAFRGPVCVLVGDDATLLAAVEQQAKRILSCSKVKVMPPAGSEPPFLELYDSPNAARCQEVKDMLADMYLLASADYTVGTMWSNFDSIAYYAAVCNYNRSPGTYVDGSQMVFGPYL